MSAVLVEPECNLWSLDQHGPRHSSDGVPAKLWKRQSVVDFSAASSDSLPFRVAVAASLPSDRRCLQSEFCGRFVVGAPRSKLQEQWPAMVNHQHPHVMLSEKRSVDYFCRLVCLFTMRCCRQASWVLVRFEDFASSVVLSWTANSRDKVFES